MDDTTGVPSSLQSSHEVFLFSGHSHVMLPFASDDARSKMREKNDVPAVTDKGVVYQNLLGSNSNPIVMPVTPLECEYLRWLRDP